MYLLKHFLTQTFALYPSHACVTFSKLRPTKRKEISGVRLGLMDDVQLLTKGHAPVPEAAACASFPYLSSFFQTSELLHYGTQKNCIFVIYCYLPVSLKLLNVLLYFLDTKLFKVSMDFLIFIFTRSHFDIVLFVLKV